MRTLVTLACTECKRRNYTTKKNKQNNPDRIELKKYCKWCGATRCIKKPDSASEVCTSIGQ